MNMAPALLVKVLVRLLWLNLLPRSLLHPRPAPPKIHHQLRPHTHYQEPGFLYHLPRWESFMILKAKAPGNEGDQPYGDFTRSSSQIHSGSYAGQLSLQLSLAR